MTSQPSDRAPDDAAIAAAIDELLDRRRTGATICPSEVARELWLHEAQWRAAMPTIRRVAGAMARSGVIVATRSGAVVDAESRGGPIRLGRPD